MAASAEQIGWLRLRVAEPTPETYSDSALAAYIEAHPLTDPAGYQPFLSDGLTANDDWTPTYDLAAAAADVWAEKAATLAGGYDFSADGGSFKRSQAYEMALRQERRWSAKRASSSHRVRVDTYFERDQQADPESVDGMSLADGYVVNDPTFED